MEIGAVIRGIREAQCATLEDVAFAAKTTASNLSRIELGRHYCSPKLLDRVSKALNVSVAEIYQRAESTQLDAREPSTIRYAENTPDRVIGNRNYEALTPEHKIIVDDLIKILLRRQKIKS